MLNNIERQSITDWASHVDEACQFNMSQPILKRTNDNKFISVNFDPQLVAILKEVKYLQDLDLSSDIPSSAFGLFEKTEHLRRCRLTLDNAARWYNDIQRTVLEVEAPLIKSELEALDTHLEQGCTSIKWDSQSKTCC